MHKRFGFTVFCAILLISMLACGSSAATQASPTSAAQNTSQASSSAPANQPPATVMKPGTYPQNITVQGAQRTYILHVPPSYDGSKPLPLVFILHGFGGNAMSMVKLTGMSDKADQENFFVAYLNGTEASSADNSVSGQAWNSGLTPELNMTVDDVEFVRELAAKLETQLNVDAKRIYAAGFSNGAFMSHRLGAELPNLLAGVAVVEGTIGIQKSDGTFAMIPNAAGPISIVIIHGKLDTNVEYDGGQATKGAGKIFAKSVADAVAFWTSADGCTGSPQQQTRPDGNVIKQDYISCSEGTEVQFFTVVNGVHEWPTLQGHTKFSATDAIWAFFSQHALP